MSYELAGAVRNTPTDMISGTPREILEYLAHCANDTPGRRPHGAYRPLNYGETFVMKATIGTPGQATLKGLSGKQVQRIRQGLLAEGWIFEVTPGVGRRPAYVTVLCCPIDAKPEPVGETSDASEAGRRARAGDLDAHPWIDAAQVSFTPGGERSAGGQTVPPPQCGSAGVRETFSEPRGDIPESAMSPRRKELEETAAAARESPNAGISASSLSKRSVSTKEEHQEFSKPRARDLHPCRDCGQTLTGSVARCWECATARVDAWTNKRKTTRTNPWGAGGICR